jgi:LysM repeat protein
MKSTLAELMLGIGTAFVSILLVTGAMMMSLGEILPAPVASLPTLSPSPAAAITSLQTATPTIDPSLVPHTSCAAPKPNGWQTYVIKPGDTVEKLASVYAITIDQLMRFNCLKTPDLIQDKELILPPLPTPTATLSLLAATETSTITVTIQPTETVETAATATPPGVCERPAGWKPYRVRSGDTLSSIGVLYNTSYLTILDANCLPRNHRLIAGEILYVPNTFTSTPKVTKTNTPEPEQPTDIPPTATTRPTNPPTPSETAVIIPSATLPSETPTDTFTPSPMPSETPTPTPTDLSIPAYP